MSTFMGVMWLAVALITLAGEASDIAFYSCILISNMHLAAARVIEAIDKRNPS